MLADTSLQDDLVLEHLPLVRKIAASLFARRSFDGVPFEEYIQFGSEGLVQAARRFNPGLGVKFGTYASRRIRGAIVSGLEKSTEVNQQVSTLRRVAQERLKSITDSNPDADTNVPTEGAPSTGERTMEQSLARLAEASIGLAIAFMLDDTALYQTESEGASNALAHWRDGASNAAYRQLVTRLNRAFEQLTGNERMVLERHYFEHDPFERIAREMGVTRGRISQLHRAGLNRLRESLG
uniref:sigma-70 family RNA polymerase sigma factor n=1 Tax=Niveibacterium sp. TaxID=2017444 RepID=UPI0035B476C1